MINDIDFICRGCYRHIPSFYIEGIIDFSKQSKDVQLARHINAVADALVTLQRCPECTAKVLKGWHDSTLKRRKKFLGSK